MTILKTIILGILGLLLSPTHRTRSLPPPRQPPGGAVTPRLSVDHGVIDLIWNEERDDRGGSHLLNRSPDRGQSWQREAARSIGTSRVGRGPRAPSGRRRQGARIRRLVDQASRWQERRPLKRLFRDSGASFRPTVS